MTLSTMTTIKSESCYQVASEHVASQDRQQDESIEDDGGGTASGARQGVDEDQAEDVGLEVEGPGHVDRSEAVETEADEAQAWYDHLS